MRRAVLWIVALAALAFVVQADTPQEEAAPGSTELRILYPTVLGGGQAGGRLLLRRSMSRTPEALLDSRGPEPGGAYVLGAPRTLPRGLPVRPCLAEEAGSTGAENPCAVGEKLSRMAPCLDGEDCKALKVWKETFGQPKTVPAKPGRD